jgi:hypothetical protein
MVQITKPGTNPLTQRGNTTKPDTKPTTRNNSLRGRETEEGKELEKIDATNGIRWADSTP